MLLSCAVDIYGRLPIFTHDSDTNVFELMQTF